MGHPTNGGGEPPGALASPERNAFYYGKLMGVEQFARDQGYFNRKRWWLNRHALGSGVVCGLQVAPDPGGAGRVRLQPGLALDGLGREVVVPEAVAVDPRRLTDEAGAQVGQALAPGEEVSLHLAYAEARTDPTPVLVPDCERPGNCAHDTVVETFRLLVRRAGDPPAPPGCTLGDVAAPVAAGLHALLAARVGAAPPAALADPSVLLARVRLGAGGVPPDVTAAGRPLVYGNALLYEVVVCLTERLDALLRGPVLRYAGGDGQTGRGGEALARPLEVEVVDGTGALLTGVTVEFAPAGGEGSVDPPQAASDGQGRARTRWTLGQGRPEQQVIARVAGGAAAVTFRATARVA
jgi:hypothetical protein